MGWTRWMGWISLVAACTAGGGAEKGSSDPDDTESSDTEIDESPVAPTSDLVDPTCLDGQYSETLADPNADVSAAVASFDPGDPTGALIAALEVRFPSGAFLLEGGMASTRVGDCIAAFTRPADRASAEGMFRAASTLVHECGHFLDIDSSGFNSSVYVITTDLSLSCASGRETPARSRIQGDDYASLRPACPASGAFGCDSYANVYLNGDPDDQRFDSGDQGFNMLMEEAVQYVNSLITDHVFRDQRGAGATVSARDGILTLLWYMERYLRLVRLEAPNQHAALLADGCWRELVLTVWGRAWLYLEVARGVNGLGIDDAELEELVLDPDLLEEIQRVRDAEGC